MRVFPKFSPEDSDLAGHSWSDNGHGYAERWAACIDGRSRSVKAHRIVFHRVNGWLPKIVEHRDGEPGNCLRNNLRFASHTQNMRNKGKHKPTSSRFKGVLWSKQRTRWQGRIVVNKRQVHLGFFTDEHEAARAYDTAALKHFGSFSRLNFPLSVAPREAIQPATQSTNT